MTTVHTMQQGDHVLAIRVDPGQPPAVHSVVYNTSLAKAHAILSRRRDLIVH